MRIIHLTDLHYSQSNRDYFKNIYIEALVKDLLIWKKRK